MEDLKQSWIQAQRDCCVLVAQSCLTLCNPMDRNPPGSSVHGILQARILEWVTIPFSRRSSWPRDQTQVSFIAGRFFTIWASSLFNKYLCSSLYVGVLLFGRWSFSKLRAGLASWIYSSYAHKGPSALNLDMWESSAQLSWAWPRSEEPPSWLMNNTQSLLCLSLGAVCYAALLWQ